MSSTMYLITKTGILIGTCVEHHDGWRFLPQTTAHQASRKAWKNSVACIPAWAFDMSDDFLTADEWKKRQSRKRAG